MRMTRTSAFALEMVQACLAFVDQRREGKYSIEMIDITPGDGDGSCYQESMAVFEFEVVLRGRDRLVARCQIMINNWTGTCWLDTWEGGYQRVFRCNLTSEPGSSASAVFAIPLHGPGSCHESLTLSEKRQLEESLGVLAASWDVWSKIKVSGDEQPHFGAWRRSWLMEGVLNGTLVEVIDAIAKYEIAHGKVSLIPLGQRDQLLARKP